MVDKDKTEEVLKDMIRMLIDKHKMTITTSPFVKEGQIMICLNKADFDGLQIIKGDYFGK